MYFNVELRKIKFNKVLIMYRIGHGYDVHRLKASRKLILAGIEVPHLTGLDGHSDADVIIHALIDALLGALALGDIGIFFPDTDEQYKDADSMKLLAKIWQDKRFSNYELGNCDITVVAECPKLSPYIEQMRKNISNVLACDIDKISIKATTTEGLGFCGKQEGIEATAVVIIKKK